MCKELLRILAVAAALQGAVISQEAIAEEPTPGYNNKIPESIMTPDKAPTYPIMRLLLCCADVWTFATS